MSPLKKKYISVFYKRTMVVKTVEGMNKEVTGSYN